MNNPMLDWTSAGDSVSKNGYDNPWWNLRQSMRVNPAHFEFRTNFEFTFYGYLRRYQQLMMDRMLYSKCPTPNSNSVNQPTDNRTS